MTMIRNVRFQVEPERTDEMLERRAAMIAAIRNAHPGLTDATLSRLDERTWVDSWRWESAAHSEAAIAGAPAIPEVSAAFELVGDVTAEDLEVIDER